MKPKVTVTPNPFTSYLSVLVNGYFTINVVIRLINSRGTVKSITPFTLQTGENKIRISNLSQYSGGQYTLEIKSQNDEMMDTIQLTKK